MEQSRFQRIEAFFQHAMDLSPGRREAFLTGACPDVDMRAEVLRLLRHADGESALPDLRGLDGAAGSTPADADPIPGVTSVGPYRLTMLIGEGGFGLVYRAEQERPVRRTVALKIIKLGMDTRRLIARFEAERQALALMEHPNIARVLDAGATDTGRPYFVMELVDGVPITQYCDERRLPARARLELLIQVCRAVQHAHQKGVIHRDLKPSNVLVTEADGKPIPKVIDFGIAKAIGARLTDHTSMTDVRQLVGTPEYMSPEQAEREDLDIDTRSDVYSLGVLLYELLTGTTPFGSERMRSATFDEIKRIIRDEEPVRPSTRLTSLDGGAERVAACRQTDVATLRRLLRGDLDWIAMQCLEKDRTRRYESAGALAADIQRALDDEPVAAGPPSGMYRMSKFVRRNRGAVAACAAVGLALLVGLIGTSFGVFWALDERDVARNEQDVARHERDVAAAVAALLDEMLRRPAIRNEFGEVMTFDEHLDAFASSLGERLAGQPEIEERVRWTLAGTYSSLERYDEAVTNIERAMELRRALWGALDFSVDGALYELAIVLDLDGRAPEAIAPLRAALDEMIVEYGQEHPRTIDRKMHLTYALLRIPDYESAEEITRHVLRVRERDLGRENSDTAWTMAQLATIMSRTGRQEEAVPLILDAIEIDRRVLGPVHWVTLKHLVTATRVMRTLSDHEGVAALYGIHRAEAREVGADPESLAELIMNEAHFSMWLPDREAHTLALFREAYALAMETGKDEVVAESLYRLSQYLQIIGRDDEAAALALEACALFRSAGPRRETWVAGALYTRALALLEGTLGSQDAEAAMGECIEILERRSPGQLPLRLLDYSVILRVNGRDEEADTAESRAMRSYRRGNLWHLGTANRLERTATWLRRLGRMGAAEVIARDCLWIRQSLAPGHPTTLVTRSRLGDLLVERASGEEDGARAAAILDEAELLLLECLSASSSHGAQSGLWLETAQCLTRLYQVRRSIGDSARSSRPP